MSTVANQRMVEQFAALQARATAAEAERDRLAEKVRNLHAERERTDLRIRAQRARLRELEPCIGQGIASESRVQLLQFARKKAAECRLLRRENTWLKTTMSENMVIEVIEDDEQGRELLAGIEAVSAARDAAEAALHERDAEIERLRASQNDGAAASGWRPIETAPKDERVLVYRPDTGTVIGSILVSVWSRLDELWISLPDRRILGFAPTHWQPLPAAPALAQPATRTERGGDA